MYYSVFIYFFFISICSSLYREAYVTSASWVAGTSNQISVVWMNRAQNNSIVSLCFSPKWICVEVIKWCSNFLSFICVCLSLSFYFCFILTLFFWMLSPFFRFRIFPAHILSTVKMQVANLKREKK